MRVRPQPTREQRHGLRDALTRIQRPDVALEVSRRCLQAGFEPMTVDCTLQTAHPDRFVVKMRLRSIAGEEADYALKVYADDFAERMWALARSLAEQDPANHVEDPSGAGQVGRILEMDGLGKLNDRVVGESRDHGFPKGLMKQ